MFDTDRLIFKFTYRGETVARDPMEVERAMKRAMPDDDAFEAMLQSAIYLDLGEVDPAERDRLFWGVVDPARREMADVVRGAFGYTAVLPDGTGMTEAEAFDLMNEYLVWKYDVKKDGPTSPDGSATSEPSQAP